MMDKKKAADLLDNLIGMIEDSGGRDYDTALKMGVEALTSKPTDCISRQAAKNAVRDELKRNPTMAIRTMNAIDELPSAQPEPDTALYVEGFNDGYKQGKKDAQPDIARDIATIIENEKDMRVILAQPEIIYCKDCLHNGSFDTDCPIEWNGKEYCSFAERRTDD